MRWFDAYNLIMQVDNERITAKFEGLLADARKMMDQAGYSSRSSGELYRNPDAGEFFRLRTEAMNLIRRICGESSDHYKTLVQFSQASQGDEGFLFLPRWNGVIQAAKNDFESGLLFDLSSLIRAEVLTDFLEQAEVLAANGYHAAAASLAGAVLEDGLRKLCDRWAASVPSKPAIDSLNSELARAGAYDKLVQKRITAIADIRNNADHGHFQKFAKEDVDDMIRWIGRFTTDFLT
jgi:hypothetical protein